MNQRNAKWIGGGLLAAGALVLLMGPGRAPMKRAGQKARRAGGRLGESMHEMRGSLGERARDVRGRLGESVGSLGERARNVRGRFGESVSSLGERARSVVGSARHGKPALSDADLEDRVDGAISRHVSRPGSVDVDCKDGDCVVSGEVRPQELSTVARTVQSIPGVQSVRTDVRETGGTDPHPGPHLA